MLLAANNKIERTIDASLQESEGLSSAEYAVLVCLSEAPGESLRLRELCDILGWDRSRASHQVTRMERKGLLSKHKCEKDARGICIVLEENGKRRLIRAVPEHVETVRRLVFDRLERKDQEAISNFLSAIVHA
nr:MarR family winged helix-turn-helix transcriptional regulator [Corynebacterium sp. sy017]